MNEAIWGLVGTIVGGVLALLANVISIRMQLQTADRRAQLTRIEVSRDERKDCYLRFLHCCRRIRYLARPGKSRPVELIDQLRTELSSITYEIELVSSAEVAQASGRLALATREYLSLSLSLDQQPDVAERLLELSNLRESARALVDQFIHVARTDLSNAPERREPYHMSESEESHSGGLHIGELGR